MFDHHMTRLTERNHVVEFVCIVWIVKRSDRDDMMDIGVLTELRCSYPATLTGVVIALKSSGPN